MAENITRCPKCQTSFRITDAHLKSAKGSVRCGSCLTIFKATDHLIKPIKEQHPAIDDSENILISDDMDHGELGDTDLFKIEQAESELRVAKTEDKDHNLFEREINYEAEEEKTVSDDSWALNLIKEIDSEDEETNSEEELEQPSHPFQGKDNTAGQSNAPDSMTWSENSFEIPEQPQKKTTDFDAFYNTGKFRIIEEEDEIEDHEQDQIIEEFEEGYYDDDHYKEEQRYEEDQQIENISSGLSAQFLDAIEPEPVEFTWKNPNSLWQSPFLWGTLSTFAAIVLFIQYAWINMDTYSRQQEYRPYYADACEVLGCKLPDLIALDQITARNIAVHPNPDQENALIVDFILQNSAFFKQEFPPIELAFTNHTNTTVAARCFTPKEYLGGELAGRKSMPIKQPIHIALHIVHPGDEASGYKIGICP